MERIEDYILRGKAERQAHLRLDEPCDERGGMSSYFKGLLAYHVGTSIPSGRKVQVCHACHNGKCSNVRHLYWGTPVDNRDDAVANGKPASPYHARVAKLGVEAANALQARIGNRNGEGNAGRPLSDTHKERIRIARLGSTSSGGRKPIDDPQLLVNLVKGTGFKEAAEKLQIDIETLRHRYYRAKKKL